MFIEEGARIQIVDKGGMDFILKDIIVKKSLTIDDNGFLTIIRNEKYNENAIFEVDSIAKYENNSYRFNGYFKDAILVNSSKYENQLYESYLAEDC